MPQLWFYFLDLWTILVLCSSILGAAWATYPRYNYHPYVFAHKVKTTTKPTTTSTEATTTKATTTTKKPLKLLPYYNAYYNFYGHKTTNEVETTTEATTTVRPHRPYPAFGKPGPVPLVLPKTQTVPIDYSNMLPWQTDYKGLLVIQPKCILNLGKGHHPPRTRIIKLQFNNVGSVRHVIVSTWLQ